MADQNKLPTLAELCRALRAKERELSELDLMLADYHTEHSRLILELRQLQTQLRAAEEAAESYLAPI